MPAINAVATGMAEMRGAMEAVALGLGFGVGLAFASAFAAAKDLGGGPVYLLEKSHFAALHDPNA